MSNRTFMWKRGIKEIVDQLDYVFVISLFDSHKTCIWIKLFIFQPMYIRADYERILYYQHLAHNYKYI